MPATILRNGWYFENYTGQLDTYLEHGAILGSAGDGRISGAARADYAEAAAAVLTAPAAATSARPTSWAATSSFTLAELAAAVSEATGQTVVYADVPAADHLAALVGAGLPEPFAEILVDVDQSTIGGALLVDSGDLRRLIGHPTTPLADGAEAGGRRPQLSPGRTPTNTPTQVGPSMTSKEKPTAPETCRRWCRGAARAAADGLAAAGEGLLQATDKCEVARSRPRRVPPNVRSEGRVRAIPERRLRGTGETATADPPAFGVSTWLASRSRCTACQRSPQSASRPLGAPLRGLDNGHDGEGFDGAYIGAKVVEPITA